MWRNYLAAALHNLFRNRAYAAINIMGLAIGFTAAILIALFLRDELSYDRAVPDADRIYRLSMDINGPSPASLGNADMRFGPAIALDFPEVEAATRLRSGSGYMKHRDSQVWSNFRYADPDFFRMFPPMTVAGDPDDALHKPGMLVISRSFARTLFGREDVVGLPVQFQLGQPRTFHVGAVVEDLPSNTHFRYDVIASTAGEAENAGGNAFTYVKFRPGTDVDRMRAALPEFVRRHVSETIGGQPAWKILALKLTALPDIHFLPPSITDMVAPSDRRTVDAFLIVALLTVLIAASNFVSMMTARAARRAIEVGVRRAVGATRRQIVLQFVAECLFYTGIALVVSVLAVELLLPGFNGFLKRQIAFDYLRSPALGASLLATWLVVALVASAYPAAVLSMFRPVTVLKGVLSLPAGNGRLRNSMVVVQFGVLIALIVSTITIHRQTRFAIEDQLRVPGDQVFVIGAPCTQMPFRDVARRIPGVLSASCASDAAMGRDLGAAHFTRATGDGINMNGGAVDKDFFRTFGIQPIAGRLFDDEHGEDNVLLQPAVTNPSIIVNESGARALGYANPADAVGKSPYWSRSGVMPNGRYGRTEPLQSQIVGVVPDFTAGTIRSVIQPSVYYIDPQTSYTLLLTLDGKKMPETIRAIEAAWKQAAGGRPMIGALFLSQMLNDLYADIQRQTRLFAAFSAVAIVVAALGLLGLAIFTAERRTREIGVRKALGASRVDILRFIGWQFARPVLIANLAAWPIAWFFMTRWLQGFAYHVDLGVLPFVLASALACGIALTTVAGHAVMVSRARPVEALRYE